jgi:hypothetical protein
MHIGFWWESQKEIGHLEELDGFEKMIVKGISERYDVSQGRQNLFPSKLNFP